MRTPAFLTMVAWLLLPATQESGNSACDTFQACEELGRTARDAGDLPTARNYYAQACFLDAAEPLLALRHNACRQATALSGQLDGHASAYALFDEACSEGNDAGCFYLALLERDRGNLAEAMRLMEPLCDARFVIHENIATNGCREYEQMEREWAVQPPPEPRSNAIQIPVFALFFLLSLTAVGLSLLRRHASTLILLVLAFAAYAYYESGVSPYAAIRVDLLLVFPMLVVDVISFIRSLLGWFRKKPNKPRTGSVAG